MAAMVWDSCGRGLVQRHALMSTLTVLLAVNADTDSTLQRCAVNKDCTETPGEFCVPIGLVCHTTPKGAAPISGGISMQWCQPGTYAPLPRNNPECLACPGGKYQEKAEQTECDCIPAGQRAVDSVILEPCPIGTYYPGDCNESAGCLECDPGRFAPSTGAAKCECSKPGYGSTETGDAEEECPADQYSEECDACKECPAGSTSEPGSTVCEVIDTTGTTSTATGRLRSTTATTTGVSQKIPAETTSETSTSATGVSQKIPAETTSETSTSATGDWGDIAIVIADSAVQAGGGGGGGGAPTPAPSCGCAEDRGLIDVVWMVVILGCLVLFGLTYAMCKCAPGLMPSPTVDESAECKPLLVGADVNVQDPPRQECKPLLVGADVNVQDPPRQGAGLGSILDRLLLGGELATLRKENQKLREDRNVFQQFVELVFPEDEGLAQLFRDTSLGANAFFDTLQRRWVAREDGSPAQGRDLPSQVEEAIQHKRDSFMQSLSKAERQLKVEAGTDEDKYTLKFIEARRQQQQSDASLACLPFEAAQIAKKNNVMFEFCLHDAMTLLKSKTLLGHELDNAVQYREDMWCRWAVADLDNFKVVNDRWSHAHGDKAIILACECIRDKVKKWNDDEAQVVKDMKAEAMRFGGDEIVFTIKIPLRSDNKEVREGLLGQVRELMEAVHKGVCEVLQTNFPFAQLWPRPKDRDQNKIELPGPAMSIGVSEMLPCHIGAHLLYLRGFKRADKLLNDYKDMWKKGQHKDSSRRSQGGGIIFADDLVDGADEEAKYIVESLQNIVLDLQTGGRPKVQKTVGNLLKEQTKELRKIMERSGAAASKMIADVEGALQVLVVATLDAQDKDAQEETSEALVDLASDAENQNTIADVEGALEGLVVLLSSDKDKPEKPPGQAKLLGQNTDGAQERAARLLWALAVDNKRNQKRIAGITGALGRVVGLLDTQGVQKQAVRLLRVLALHDDNKTMIADVKGALRRLVGLLGSKDVQEQAAGTLRYLAAGDANNKKKIAAEALPGLTRLLGRGSPGAQEQAAGAIRNLTAPVDRRSAAGGARSTK